MSKAFIRPIILLLVFFIGLYILRDPLKNAGQNFDAFNDQYIAPTVSYFKNIWSSSATSSFPSFFNSPYNAVPGSASTTSPSKQLEATQDVSIKQISIPQLTIKDKEVLVSKNNLDADDSQLTINGVLNQTNKERTSRQFPSLKLDTELNKSAEQKLQDMFTNQYFQHVSPTGVNVSDLVRKAGYDYIVVGENLALGNFGGDVQVVTAWMNSPGHRANILDPRFQEIGIAVGKGMYNGKEQWIAVQHFGKPLSSCTGPSDLLKAKINQHTEELATIEKTLSKLKAEIEQVNHNSSDYHDKISEYNNKVLDYNAKLEAVKDEIANYNEQVRKFNTCAGLK